MNDSSETLPPPFPKQGRLLGLDYGTVRVGIAVTTPEQTIASPLETYSRRSPALDAQHFRTVAEEIHGVGIVVGLPMHTGGEEGQKAREARTFGNWVAQQTRLPLMFWDERFTTALAEEHLRDANVRPKKRRALLDKLAAQIMLQSFLDAN